ncbi:MAG TPA: hypothetical protein VFG10_08665 [Saprospiraceae bacterium]|nr:hypothetical protein [Saprospiraceae bacterium]
MMDSLRIKTGLILLWGLFFLNACNLDNPVNSGNDPALTLHAEQNLSLVTLSWDPVLVTGFKEYIILQSTTDIPNTPEPVINAETTVLKRIDNRNIHSVEVSNTLFAAHLCYKLYTSVDERFLYSSTICLDQDFTLFNGFNDRAGHEAGLDKVVMFDRINARLSVLDYKNEIIDWTLSDNVLSFPIIEVSTFEGTTNVYAYDQSPPRLRKYKFPELLALNSKDFGNVLFAMRTYKQFIFASVDDFSKTFQVLNRSNFNTVSSSSGMSGNRNIALFEGDPLIVIEIGENFMIRYSIDATGKIIQTEPISAGVSQLSTENTTANNDAYFIGGRAGNIVNRNGEILGAITSNVNFANLLNRFSRDNTKVISIINSNVKTTLEINDISSLPVITRIQSFDLPPATYADIIVEDHIMYVIGVTFASGQAQTFILKYPI